MDHHLHTQTHQIMQGSDINKTLTGILTCLKVLLHLTRYLQCFLGPRLPALELERGWMIADSQILVQHLKDIN